MRVLMVDDHTMFLQGMQTLLAVLAPQLALETARTRLDALACIAVHAYEVILLDWNLGDCTGAELLADLRDAGCSARVVVVSGESDPVRICRMLESGVAGFIPKTHTGEKLLEALNSTLQGQLYIPVDLLVSMGGVEGHFLSARSPDFDDHLALLTPRQLDVFRAAARGLPNKLIARELGVSEATVKSHLSVVFVALRVNNRTQAALLASRAGFRVGSSASG